MKFKPTKKMVKALEGTVYAYEKAICDLENGDELHPDWSNYGSAISCRLCNAMNEGIGSPQCQEKCFLGLGNGPIAPCTTPRYKVLANTLNWISGSRTMRDKELLEHLKARLAWILDLVDERDWELVK